MAKAFGVPYLREIATIGGIFAAVFIALPYIKNMLGMNSSGASSGW